MKEQQRESENHSLSWWIKHIPGSEHGLFRVVQRGAHGGFLDQETRVQVRMGDMIKGETGQRFRVRVLDDLPQWLTACSGGKWICRVELPRKTTIRFQEGQCLVNQLVFVGEPVSVKEFFFGKDRPPSFFLASFQDQWAIQFASSIGDVSLVERLLQQWSDQVDPSAHDQRAIQLASFYGHSAVVNRLLQDSRVDPSVNEQLALAWASERGHVEVVQRLFEDSRVEPVPWAIDWASRNGHFRVVNRLLEDPRVDPSGNGGAADQYPLLLATREGHVQVVDRLLQDPRVDPSAQSQYAIEFSSFHQHLEVVRLLLMDPRVDPNRCRW